MIKTLRGLSILTPLLLGLSGCGSDAEQEGTLQVWVHSGQQAERQTIEQQVERFNASQEEITVKLTFIPEGSYNSQIQAASLSKDLPDVLEFDGPFVYNYVWQRNLIPLDALSKQVRQDLLPSIIQQGTYKGRLYSVGSFDSGLGLYGRRSQLKAAGVRIPTGNEDAWTVTEFNQALAALAEKDPDRQVLDLKLNNQGEWFTFFEIIVPLSKPVFATVAILTFLTQWGAFLWPLMITVDENVRPLPVAITSFQTLPPVQWGDIMSFGVMMVTPILLIFLLFQKWFVKGVAATGSKG